MKDENEITREVARDRSSSIRIKTKRREVKPFTKIVLRRLPGRLTKEQLISQLQPLPEYNYLNFVKPDWTLGSKFAYARAYINFINPNDVFQFKNKYDGRLFYHDDMITAAVVEFAPFQRIPKKRLGRRKDDKCGTIEQCEVYKQFINSFTKQFNSNNNENRSITTISYENNNNNLLWYQKMMLTSDSNSTTNLSNHKKSIITTPLLDFIKQQKLDKQKLKFQKKQMRDKERKLRRDSEKKYLQHTFEFQKNDNNSIVIS